MSTTTVRLDDELKARVDSAARKAGVSTHSFILQAIAEKAEQSERYTALQEEAASRFEDFLANGKTIPWTEMRAYLEKRIKGEKTARPRARRIAR